MNRLLATGLTRLFRGLRTGNPGLTVLGAAAVALKWFRDHRRPKRELLWSATLKPGQGVRIRVPETGEELEVEA